MTAPAPQRLLRLRAGLRSIRLDQRGTAVVEFALVAPILFALLIGMLDFGRALNYYNQQTQLVGMGARAAAVSWNPDGLSIASGTSIQTQLATTYATGELHNNTTICIPSVPKVGQPVTVTASYDFQLVPIPLPGLSSVTQITLRASQSMRQEATPTYLSGCSP